MRTRRFGATALSLLASFSLVAAACGDDDDDGAEGTEGTSSEETAADGTAATTAEGTAAEGTTPDGTSAPTAPPRGDADLVIWADDTRQAVVQGIADVFGEENGITVVVQEVPSDVLREQFNLTAPTGEGPDIVVGANDWIGELSTNGVLEPLTIPNPQDFAEVAIEAFTYDGTLYGVPYAIENIALIRNTELVPEAPATWEEMVQIANDYKAQYPDDPTQLGIAVQVGAEGDPYHFQPTLSAFGGYMLGQNEDGTFNIEDVGIDSPGGLEAAAFLAEAAGSGILSADVEYDVMITSFGEGKAPFAITGPWAIAEADRGFAATGVPYEVTPIPAREGGEPPAVFVGVQGFMVSSFSEQKDLALSFVQDYMTQQATQLAMFEAGGRAPAHVAAFEEVSTDPDVAGFGEAGAAGIPLPVNPEIATVFTEVGLAEANVLKGADPTTEFTNAANAIREQIGG
jgi:arabinogalactan oligomer/maltooligosaccharide transport system substrate-binding protein